MKNLSGYVRFTEGDIDSQNEVAIELQQMISEVHAAAVVPNPNYNGMEDELQKVEEYNIFAIFTPEYADFWPTITDTEAAKKAGFYTTYENFQLTGVFTPTRTATIVKVSESNTDSWGDVCTVVKNLVTISWTSKDA